MEWADAVLVQREQAPGQALCLTFNILHAAGSPIFKTDPEAEAVDRLKDLIHKHGKWIEPAQQTAAFGTVS
jgi:hypothetical protein